jgi:hypothetical protein
MAPLARRPKAAHIRRMASRPCKPSADLKQLWRALLPGTPFPACGTGPDEAVPTAPAAEDAPEPDAPRPARTR